MQDAERMHEYHAQQAIAQMPEITRPNPFNPAAIRQLPKDGINAIAHTTQNGTPTVSGLGASFAKGSQQHDPDVGRSQVHLGDHPRPTQAQMQTEAVKGLPTGMIFPKVGCIIKTMAAIGSRKLADRDGHTIDDGYRWIREQECVTDQAPEPLFDGPQVRRLAYKRRASHPCHFGKEMRVV